MWLTSELAAMGVTDKVASKLVLLINDGKEGFSFENGSRYSKY